MQKMGLEHNFWFGHQGWEYVDSAASGRSSCSSAWACGCSWSGARCGRRSDGQASTSTLALFLSTVAIGLFYGAGLMWGEHTHLSMVEYWRWWVVHLWVEGFFEVFATAVIAFLFTKLGLLRAVHRHGGRAVRHHRVPGRRRARHLPPPLLHRHAHGRHRDRRQLLGAGSGAAGPDRLRGLREPGASPRRGAVGGPYKWPIMFFVAWRSGTWWAPACSAS
jgi:hypothetical protein